MIVDLFDFVREARDLDEQAFLARYPDPVLLVEPFSSQETMGYQTRVPAPETGHDRGVVLLSKREEANAFRLMVTIGRAKNNDVLIPADDISKFHAYLLRRPRQEGVFFADAGSTFGTKVNGEQLAPRQPVELHSGASIEFGTVRTTYYSPESFRALLLQIGGKRAPGEAGESA